MRGKFSLPTLGQPPHAWASMRPAHCAREVVVQSPDFVSAVSGFNEARALCAGSSPLFHLLDGGVDAASMRPAHCAREVEAFVFRHEGVF